jgi:RNA polymerase sigma-70 factor (ECF subfamily)
VTKVPFDYEDLVQETFTRMLAKRDSYRGDASFKVYLLGFARLVLLEHFRARQRDRRFEPMDSSAADLGGARASSILVEREDHRILLDALRHLDLRDQELLELYYWQDLSAREVAEVQGVLESTVRSRVRAALKRLTQRFTKLSLQARDQDLDPRLLEGWLHELRAQLGPGLGSQRR